MPAANLGHSRLDVAHDTRRLLTGLNNDEPNVLTRERAQEP
jgi:hypothetical protein